MIFGKDSTKTSVALATESSVYVWSRAPVVLVNCTTFYESKAWIYRSFLGQNSLFYDGGVH